eukprot:CAMPEP_0206472040 /NCGR_PEP_ID=MMETSP0324_2-20121206/31943_1 /ASSEMBLY_ACC=CAM_ASM_000836 /TAXON_ID=2866 /ORGANISM="Crypthecodinium cohnii, Strain Seligo" /LENGTH=70 /DNA_ID=CAMNT_0053946523 /DNA_START=213 /DNA_END=425 /DNA_ORIENTATION=+
MSESWRVAQHGKEYVGGLAKKKALGQLQQPFATVIDGARGMFAESKGMDGPEERQAQSVRGSARALLPSG